MTIQTTKHFNLSDIATTLGVDPEDLAELADGAFTWGDTDCALVSLPKFLGLLEESEEETVMEVLWDIIGTEPAAAAEYFVNLAA
jgi:hypothetical protein